MHNFTLVCADTDSFTVCKPDGSPFSKEETDRLTQELSDIFPERINWEFEFNYPKMLVLKAKNYIMLDNKGKKKLKGSALKSATLEPALKQFLNEMIDVLLQVEDIEERNHNLLDIYEKYVKMISDIKDITPWAKKQTLSKVTFDGERKNETDVIDAIKGKEYGPGDKIYLISKAKMIPTGEIYKVGKDKGKPKMKKSKILVLLEDFDGEYDRDVYYDKLYKCIKRFETVLPVKEMFKKRKHEDDTEVCS